MARRFATRIGAIRANRFAQIDSQKDLAWLPLQSLAVKNVKVQCGYTLYIGRVHVDGLYGSRVKMQKGSASIASKHTSVELALHP